MIPPMVQWRIGMGCLARRFFLGGNGGFEAKKVVVMLGLGLFIYCMKSDDFI